MHWDRWRHYGNPLAGRAFNGEPLKYLRETVLPYDGAGCLLWPFARNRQGYAVMRHKGRNQLVSRIVCEKAHGPPPDLGGKVDAAHACDQGHLGCVAKRHLAWKGHGKNLQDKRFKKAAHATALLRKRGHEPAA